MMKGGRATNGFTLGVFVFPPWAPKSALYRASQSQKILQFKVGQDNQFNCHQITNVKEKDNKKKNTNFPLSFKFACCYYMVQFWNKT